MHPRPQVISAEPPPIGAHLELRIDRPPVSVQSSRTSKDAFRNLVRQKAREYEYILTCDVQIEVDWLIHERLRYESDT
jgi:hypothetical protein